MVTPVETGIGKKTFDWIKHGATYVFKLAKRIATLEERVAALEQQANGKQPGDACPYCGERAMRLKHQHHIKGEQGKQTTDEDWQCEKCGEIYNKREPIWTRRP